MKNFNVRRHSKIYQIIGLIIVSILLILLSYNFTMSWFMDQSKTSNSPTIAVVGEIKMKITTNFDFYNLVLAPDTVYTTDQDDNDIGTYIRTNDSTIGGGHDIKGVYVRIQSTITRNDSTLGVITCPEFSLHFASGKVTSSSPTSSYSSSDGNMWVYNDSDDYWYYLGEIGTSNVQFNDGYETNNSIINAIAEDDVNIRFQIEAIQKPYGAYQAIWTTAPKIFTTFASSDSVV